MLLLNSMRSGFHKSTPSTPYPSPKSSIFRFKPYDIMEMDIYSDADSENEGNGNQKTYSTSSYSYFQYPNENEQTEQNRLLIKRFVYGEPYSSVEETTYETWSDDDSSDNCSSINEEQSQNEICDNQSDVSSDDASLLEEFGYLSSSISLDENSPTPYTIIFRIFAEDIELTNQEPVDINSDSDSDSESESDYSFCFSSLIEFTGETHVPSGVTPTKKRLVYVPTRFLNKVCNIGEEIPIYDKLVELKNPKDKKSVNWFKKVRNKFSRTKSESEYVTSTTLQDQVKKMCCPLNPEDFENELEYGYMLSKQNAFINCFL